MGYLLIDDTTANEQNALGNWLMLVAQVLCTNAFYRQVMQERGLEPANSTESGNSRNPNSENKEETIEMLKKMMNAIQKELNDLKQKV